tara:strand:+ start:4892 stop:5491 length:600 start_codon:yes stop_codon:yes gene_type:complete
VYVQADNLEPFVLYASHPICGYNPAFDHLQSAPAMPFAKCRTLAVGYDVSKSYPDPGVDALSKLLIAIADAGGWDFYFAPLNQIPLECQIRFPLYSPTGHIPVPDVGNIPAPGFGAIPATPSPYSAAAQFPPCTVKMLKDYVDKYNAQPIVDSVKRFEQCLLRLDLDNSDTVQQLLKITAVIKVAGTFITLDEITELLE